MLEQLIGFWQMAMQDSGSTHPTSFGYRTRDIIPAKSKKSHESGKSFLEKNTMQITI
jgi:hypothetical protein